MKINQILTSKNNFGPITLEKNNSFTRIEKFLANQDPICSENYYQNKENLTIFYLDKMDFDQVCASYLADGNLIYIKDYKNDLTHELMHMSSTKFTNEDFKIFSTHKVWDNELLAIEEGITEFLASLIDNKPIDSYGIRSFVASMLYTSTDGEIIIPYLTADGQSFIEMFNPQDIHNLLFNLSVIQSNEIFGIPLDVNDNHQGYINCFFDMLESLIDIELRNNPSHKKLMKYRELFLSSLEDELVKSEIAYCLNLYSYHNKARNLIDLKILRRKLNG